LSSGGGKKKYGYHLYLVSGGTAAQSLYRPGDLQLKKRYLQSRRIHVVRSGLHFLGLNAWPVAMIFFYDHL
jgi:hypothetical protein